MVLDQYGHLYDRLDKYNQEIQRYNTAISELDTRQEEGIPARIKKLEEQLEKIDTYMLKIKGFQELAKKNIDSLNVLSLEIPDDYRINLKRLKNWASLIDPTGENDPYAQRVYVTAKCDEAFLNKKKTEFTDTLNTLKENETVELVAEKQRLNMEIQKIYEQMKEFLLEEEVKEFAQATEKENKSFWFEQAPEKFEPTSSAEQIALGAYALPFPCLKEQSVMLKGLFGKFCDGEKRRILIPVELSLEKEFMFFVSCTPSKSRQLDKGLQNLILNLIEKSAPGMHKVYVLDSVRYSSAGIGSLKQLENTFALAQIPRNPEQLTNCLEQIVSGFADMDELLGTCDSVLEYNQAVAEAKKIPRTTLIIYGWPGSVQGKSRELLNRILTNYERYGISCILVSYKTERQQERKAPEFVEYNCWNIQMLPNDTYIWHGEREEEKQHFVWYSFSGEISETYASSLKEHVVEKATIGNEYIKRYQLDPLPAYTREYKKLSIPFGIDGKDQVHSVSFENENFATYLVGASRSGKSTLLHTLIAGLIRNYHPDNLELWLADFKQLEFKNYIDHQPPHVKYVLLDESPELVYDLLDRLTDKMMERQHLFGKLNIKRIDQVKPETLTEPMPVIFVILDEFSIMSQAIAESQIYKIKLQNILAKGAALGIRFLFASQSFTTGIGGLTATAKAQIQQRIAMKASREEISETLELSANLKTEQVKLWMEALPPHYALIKQFSSEDSLPEVKRLLVMYFKDYGVRDKMIDDLRNHIMHKSDTYQPGDSYSYVDKHPVFVDGNSYKGFSAKKVEKMISEYKEENTSELSDDDRIFILGAPRRMADAKFAIISNESRENVLLIAPGTEQNCAVSILLTMMKTFQMQGGHIRIWAYAKNRIYKACKNEVFREFEIAEGMAEICAEISEIRKRIENKEFGEEFILLLGMEQICMDFSLIDFRHSSSSHSSVKVQNTLKKNMVSTEQEQKDYDAMKESRAAFEKMYDIDQMEEDWMAEGKSIEDIVKEEERLYDEFLKSRESLKDKAETDSFATPFKEAPEAVFEEPIFEEEMPEDMQEDVPYNAEEDFKYIVMQGSRFGYHFMLCINNLSDMKATQLQQDWFKHKLAFQISGDDSSILFGSKIAAGLPEHICQYNDTLEQYSLRPFIHKGASWDGWEVDEEGNAYNIAFT